jgi:Zn-dependent peptidase ImmA (M78 family)
VNDRWRIESQTRALARAEALKIHVKWETQLRTPPVSTLEVAGLLGIGVKRSTDVSEPGRLHYSNSWAGREYTIVVRSDLPPATERFVIAHEIGHAVLLRRDSNIDESWAVWQREVFANAFAHQLLVPPATRDGIIAEFRAIDDPFSLLGLAGRMGLWPHALLRFADQNGYLKDLGRIWVRAKRRPNRHTGLEPKLRIITAHYDRQRYFVPVNQSLDSFCGGEDWLAGAEAGKTKSVSRDILITEKQMDAHPRFRHARRSARVGGIRLSASVLDGEPVFLILADLTASVPG